MEYEKFCGLDAFGVYSFVFPNKHALELEQIQNYFAKFEGYLNVKAAFGDTGMRFIRFATFENAKKAMDALQDHPTMRLVPYERKSNASEILNKQEDNTCKKSYDQKGEINGKAANKNSEFNPTRYRYSFGAMRLQKFRGELFKLCGDKSSNSYSSKREKKAQLISEINQVEVTNENEKKEDSDADSLVSETEDVKCIEKSVPSVKQEPKFFFDELKSEFNQLVKSCKRIQKKEKALLKTEQSINSKLKEIYGKSVSVYNKKQDVYDNFMSSKNVTQNYRLRKKAFPGLVTDAAEIVVGNVPSSLKPAYFLHLFDKFEPIAISHMNHVEDTEIRYCYIYFKSEKDASKAISEFNSFNLNEKKLLVLFSRSFCKTDK